MIAASDVSAVLVTRGDVDVLPVIESLACFAEVLVWDNSCETDCSVFGRYAAIPRAKHAVVYVQDDDCVLEPEAFRLLLAGYEPDLLVANMPGEFRHRFYDDHCLVGFGALFDRALPARAFDRWYHAARHGLITYNLDVFKRTCDVIFTALTRYVLVDGPKVNLPWANDDSRMWKQPDHVGERTRMLELARRVRDA